METKTMTITDRIKSYEDACKELGNSVRNFDGLTKDVVAYIKLTTIARALNEGWVPQFTGDEYRYFPYFIFYTKKEINDMSENEKKHRSLLLFGGIAHDGAFCGLGFAYSNYAFSYASSALGARLAVKNRELARYFGRQFIDIWADFVFIGDE